MHNKLVIMHANHSHDGKHVIQDDAVMQVVMAAIQPPGGGTGVSVIISQRGLLCCSKLESISQENSDVEGPNGPILANSARSCFEELRKGSNAETVERAGLVSWTAPFPKECVGGDP